MDVTFVLLSADHVQSIPATETADAYASALLTLWPSWPSGGPGLEAPQGWKGVAEVAVAGSLGPPPSAKGGFKGGFRGLQGSPLGPP